MCQMAEGRATCSDRMKGSSNARRLSNGQPVGWAKPIISAEGIVAVGETSRGNHGGLTPAKARTVPGLNSTGK